MEEIDVVLPYVNHNDQNWLNEIKQYTNEIDLERFRSFDNLDILLKLINKNMSWVRNIYLVVSSDTQITDYIRRIPKVKVVLHKDIIPQELLPTFNALTIEFFFNRIPDLSEKYIYFNDDMFPLKELSPTEFFHNDKPCLDMKFLPQPKTKFGLFCLNNKRLIEKDIGRKLDNEFGYWCPKHYCLPILKTTMNYFWDKYGNELTKSFSKFRQTKNFTQYLFSQWHYYRNDYIPIQMDFNYVQFDYPFVDIVTAIREQKHKLICINDDCMYQKYFEYYKKKLNSVLLENLNK